MIAALLAVALAAPSSDAPLGLRTQGTFRELFLDPILSDARPPARPSVDVRWSFANDWTTPTIVSRGARVASLQADEQADSFVLSARVPWGGRASTSLEWRVTEHWGGWSDEMIEGWHRVIQVYQFGRTTAPRNAVRIRLGPAQGSGAIDLGSPRFAWGDLVLRTQVALARGGRSADGERDRWAVSARADLKAPLGRVSDAGGSGGWDAAGLLLGTIELSPALTLHGGTSAMVASDLPSAAVVQPRRWNLGADASLAWRVRAVTILVEDRVRTSVLEGGWSFVGTGRRSSAFLGAFRPHNQVSAGVRWRGVTAWFSEDVTPGGGDPSQGIYYLSNVPDFVFGLAWARDL